MERLILTTVFLLLLTGCTVADNGITGEASDLLGRQIALPNTQLPSVNETSDSASSEDDVSGSEIIEPKDIIKHNVTLYNNIGAVINEVHLVKGGISELLASDIQPDSDVLVQWLTTEQYSSAPDDLRGGESIYFMLIVGEQKIPIMTARVVDSDIREELYITSDGIGLFREEDVYYFSEIAFFREGDVYYFSPQPDYPDREENSGARIFHAQYLYLPQVRRWLLQRKGQCLFAVGLGEGEIRTYFPNYTGDIPQFGPTVVISCETIYLEDVCVEFADDFTVTEVRESDELRTFTPDDVIVISVDHVRGPRLYFRYRDAQGNVYRQYVTDQFRDNNNGGVVNPMLTLDDEYYKLVPVE